MHNIVPQFILEQYATGNFNGEFPAVGLFADITGFSAITEALMHHGQHGAEELAMIMRAVFEPMIKSVYQQKGFIATLAGDSITALFLLSNSRVDDYLRPLAAAWEIHNSVGASHSLSTNFGKFNISAKLGLALGEIDWGIVTSQDQHRAVYYFHGTAIERCTEAESLSGPGEIVVDPELFKIIHKNVNETAVGQYYTIQGMVGELPPQQHIAKSETEFSNMIKFYPQELVNQTYNGEFRQVVNLFVNLPTIRTKGQLEIFMQSVFELQDNYGGLVNRLDFGDKGAHMLMFWGAPVAYENDIERALDFILTLQEETSIPFHAGVTYQISHAGFIGSDLREEYTCYGEGVNLASRFMVSAPRGMIWIDERIADRAESLHQIDFIGEKSFKGFTEKQSTYVLLERKDEYMPFFRGEMVGREGELDKLADFIQPLKEEGFAGVFIIWGEAGIGKSRLVHEFQNSDDFLSQKVLWAVCQTDQLLREAFNPFRYWLQGYFGVSDTQGEARNKRSFNQRLDLLIAKTEDEALIEELDRTRTFIGALLGLYWPDSLFQQSEAQGRYENTLMGLATLLLTESTIQPVIIHLEDAHWLDVDSKSFLSYLTARSNPEGINPYRIAIIATARPEENEVILGEVKTTSEITLEKFSKAEIARLAVKILSSPASSRLRTLLAQRADGNPFFTEQILYYLLEQELLQLSDDEYDIGNISHSLLPTDVRAVLVARLDRLSRGVKEVVHVASILGREFEVSLLSQMLSNESNLIDKLSAAEQGAIWSPLSENRYIFKHALMQDAAYHMQLQTKRQELHASAVNALEKQYSQDLSSHYSSLAYHSEMAGDHDRAFPYFGLAAERAEQIYANDEAINYYSRAIELSELVSADAVSETNLHRGRGRAFETKGDFDQARSDFETSFHVAHNADQSQMEWRAIIDLGKLWASRDYQKTRDYFEDALELARQKDNPAILGGSLNWMGNWTANNEQPLQAVVYHQEALQIFEQLGNTRDIANTLDLLGIAHLLAGDYSASVKYYDQAIPIFRELDDRPRLISSLIGRGVIVSLGILLAMVPPDPAPDAQQDFIEARQIAREIGSSPDEAWASWAQGLLYTLGGNFGGALEVARDGAKIASEIGHREWLVGNLFASGVLYCELLAPDKALLELQRALELAVELRSQYWITHVTGAQATAYLILGDLSKAQSSLDTVITSQTPMDTKGRRYCWARRAELALTADDRNTALSITERLIASAAGMAPERVITFLWLLKGKALAAMDRMEDAETLLHSAAANAQKTKERFLLWRIHASLGRLYKYMDHGDVAQDEISAARSLIEEMASTIPDEELKQNFRQRASEAL
jgi:class 3 adenylate cyclase/tetratricopeptide (TPR) repeat protein